MIEFFQDRHNQIALVMLVCFSAFIIKMFVDDWKAKHGDEE